MNAANIISLDVPQLRTSTKGNEALDIMGEFFVEHLPIVNNEQLLGIISAEDILENDGEESIGSYHLSLQYPHVKDTDHIFDVLSLLAKTKLSVVPVVDRESNFLGVITRQDLVEYLANGFSFAEVGGIVVLEMAKPDYALSEIARVVESENIAILGVFVTNTDADDNKIYVHIKINKPDIHRVTTALERFGYSIFAIYAEEQDEEMFKDRFESFMHYLNV